MTPFEQAVRDATTDTPYVVTSTPQGFDVTLDVVDAQWFGLFDAAGLTKVHTHHVAVAGERYSITDDAREVEWVAGTPRAAATAERQYGRVIELGAEKVWAFDARGRFGVRADYRFDSEEGRQLITGLADHLGLKARRGAAERTGLILGAIGGVGALVTLVVLAVLALLGKF